MAATAVGAAVVAKVAPEIITTAVKLPDNLSKNSLLDHVRKQQELLNQIRSKQAEAVVFAPEPPSVIPVDAPLSDRAGTFYAQCYDFQIEYVALHHMDYDRVSLKASRELQPEPRREYYDYASPAFPPHREFDGMRSFEGNLHEAITMVNRKFPDLAIGIRQAIMSCNPEWRHRVGQPTQELAEAVAA